MCTLLSFTVLWMDVDACMGGLLLKDSEHLWYNEGYKKNIAVNSVMTSKQDG